MNEWDYAEEGEVWELCQSQGDGEFETMLWTRMSHGQWRSVDGKWWLLEDEDIALVQSGKRVS